MMPGSAAEQSGLRVGYIITSVENRNIKNPTELATELSTKTAGSQVKIALSFQVHRRVVPKETTVSIPAVSSH